MPDVSCSAEHESPCDVYFAIVVVSDGILLDAYDGVEMRKWRYEDVNYGSQAEERVEVLELFKEKVCDIFPSSDPPRLWIV